MANLLKTTTADNAPLDGSAGTGEQATVSDFLTLQSLTNFGAMTGALTLAWHALQKLSPQWFSALWVPFAFAAAWGVVSIAISWDGLKNSDSGKIDPGNFLGAVFIAVINTLVLASAVVGAVAATT